MQKEKKERKKWLSFCHSFSSNDPFFVTFQSALTFSPNVLFSYWEGRNFLPKHWLETAAKTEQSRLQSCTKSPWAQCLGFQALFLVGVLWVVSLHCTFFWSLSHTVTPLGSLIWQGSNCVNKVWLSSVMMVFNDCVLTGNKFLRGFITICEWWD